MVSSTDKNYDKGMINLIHQKLDRKCSLKDIGGMLLRAGFRSSIIKEAIQYAQTHERTNMQKISIASSEKQNHDTKEKKHHEVMAATLSEYNSKIIPVPSNEATMFGLGKIVSDEIHHKGLFNGRLRRKDFIMGFLFFFGIGFIFLSVIISLLQALTPTLWNQIIAFIEQDTVGVWLMYIPFIFAPLTVMILSLIVRRLHNLELPGWIAFMFLFIFVSPIGYFSGYSLLGIHFALAVLFILLITKKGHPAPNKHGALPPSHGSMFKRILGHGHESLHLHTNK